MQRAIPGRGLFGVVRFPGKSLKLFTSEKKNALGSILGTPASLAAIRTIKPLECFHSFVAGGGALGSDPQRFEQAQAGNLVESDAAQ